jgi:peptidoglycan/LPS O-acetylase OafA/YrhL
MVSSGPLRLAALDGWRGICAMGVVLYHATRAVTWSGSDFPLLNGGSLFVDYFFVLSGFVMGITYDARVKDVRSAGVFMLRRFGRLWPLHVAMLGFYVALVLIILAAQVHLGTGAGPAFTDNKTPASLVTNLLLIHSLDLHGQLTWNTPSWSISVEFWTYAVFACILVGVRRYRTIIAVGLASAGLLGVVASGKYMDATFDYGIFRCLYGFFVGYLVFRFSAARADRPAVKLPSPFMVEALVIAMLVLYLSYLNQPPLSLIGPVLFAFSVFIFSLEQGPISRLLSRWPFSAMGAHSYSIYMIHIPLLALSLSLFHFDTIGGANAVVIAYATGVPIVATLTYRFIENPWRKYFNTLAVRLSLRRSVALSPQPH